MRTDELPECAFYVSNDYESSLFAVLGPAKADDDDDDDDDDSDGPFDPQKIFDALMQIIIDM